MRLLVTHRILQHCLIVCIFSIFCIGYGQQLNSDLKFKNYELFFEQPREEIFLDLPKNTFFVGEPVKFAGYVFDQIGKVPSVSSSNVYCSLYNEYGSLVESKIFYVEKGKFHGEMNIPVEKGSGKYYIKAYTNWMKNFPDEFMFMQEIFLIDENINTPNQIVQVNNNIHIYPEGGHLVSEINNSIGFSVIVNQQNNASYESCTLTDQMGNELIQNIRINQQGYGKLSFIPKAKNQYYLTVRLESGDVIRKPLPASKDKGLTLILNPTSQKNISLEINCDPSTFKRLKKAPLTLAIHRDGVLNTVNYQMRSPNSSVILPKGVVLPGLNKLSIFNSDHQLMAERVFFNDTHIRSLQNTVTTELKKKAKDSLTVSLAIEGLRRGSTSQLSISVLPNESKAHDYNWSLSSWFLLQSYYSKQLDSDVFIQNLNRQRLFDLDLFLLNNEWNRYDWSDINQPQKAFDHPFEKGISLKGQFSGDDALKNKELILYQKSIGEFFSTRIDNELRFSVNDLYLVEDEPILFFTKDYTMKKFTKVDLNYFPSEETHHLSATEIERFLTTKSIDLKKSLNPVPVTFPDTELLDEIVLKTDIEPKLTRNPSLNIGTYEGAKISERDIFKHIMLSNYLQKKGFKVRRHAQTNKFILLPKSAADIHLPIVFVDGMRESNYISDYLLQGIDEIYYEHFGVEGSDGGTVYIYRKYGNDGKQTENKLLQTIAKVGFSAKASDTRLKFTEFMKNQFVSYGNVYWNGNIELERGDLYEIKFPTYSLKEFRIYINGISDKGDIISASKYISVD